MPNHPLKLQRMRKQAQTESLVMVGIKCRFCFKEWAATKMAADKTQWCLWCGAPRISLDFIPEPHGSLQFAVNIALQAAERLG